MFDRHEFRFSFPDDEYIALLGAAQCAFSSNCGLIIEGILALRVHGRLHPRGPLRGRLLERAGALLDLDGFVRLYVESYERADEDTRALLPLARIWWPA
ncbi:MAG: hypothetical protein ACLR3M_05525 [Collinsella sp.]